MALPVLAVSLAPAQAGAAGVSRNTTSPVSVSPLPSSEVQEVLAGVPLKDLSDTQLSEVLAKLPGLSALPAGKLREALTKTVEALSAKNETLGELVSSPELASKLEAQLNELLSLSKLGSLLGGKSLSSVLGSGLGSITAGQLLGELLSSASTPEQLIERVLGASSPEKLQALLGSTLNGEPFTKTTVAGLAGELGTTSEGLAEDLNTATSELPANAMALTAPLTDGKTLGVLDGLEGLDLGLLGSKEKAPEGSGSGPGSGSGSGGSGSGGSSSGGSGSGGSGGSGGSAGTPAGTTVVVNLPGQSASTQSASTKATLKILSHKVKGHVVTLVVQVSAAGSLTLTGKGIHAASKQADRAERVTVIGTLSKAGVASLRGHRHGLKIKLSASFAPVSGTRSSVTTTVMFG